MSDYLDPNNEELLKDFFAEAEQQVEQLESNVLVIENDPANHEAIDEIFRAAHTLKGGSATVEMMELSTFTHSVEDVLDEIRSDRLSVDEDVVDILLTSIDVIKAMLESRRHGTVYEEDTSGVLNKLHAYLPEGGGKTKAKPKAPSGVGPSIPKPAPVAAAPAPSSGIPLFIGAECYELMKAQKEKKTSSSDEDEYYNKAIDASMNILDSFTNAMNPMTEMSMLSGLTSALKSYDQGSSKMLAGIGTNSIKSYVNQFIPTALGQIAKTTDEYERNTTSTKTGVLPKAIDTTRTQIMNKIPGLRQKLPIKTDIWGQEQKQSDNIALRALENAVFPWARKELNSNNVDKEITKVYENTGESSVFPDTINKNLTIDKKKYVMNLFDIFFDEYIVL